MRRTVVLPELFTGQAFLTYNARAAIYQLLKMIGRPGTKVLVPSFHCVSLIEPIVQAGYDPVYYGVHPSLAPDLESIRRQLGAEVSVTIVINYFGFPADVSQIREEIRTSGSLLVEDCAHCFAAPKSSTGHIGDYAVYSFYKFLPSLLGGCLVKTSAPELRQIHYRPLTAKQNAVILKRLFEQAAQNSPQTFVARLFFLADRWRLALRRRKDSQAPVSRSAFLDDAYHFDVALAKANMPYLCRRIAETADWEEARRRRRENYSAIDEVIKGSNSLGAVFGELPESVTPFMYPVLMKNRNQHEQALRKEGVPFLKFGHEHHPTFREQDMQMTETADILANSILLLPVHQQLSATDARAIASMLVGYADKKYSTAG